MEYRRKIMEKKTKNWDSELVFLLEWDLSCLNLAEPKSSGCKLVMQSHSIRIVICHYSIQLFKKSIIESVWLTWIKVWVIQIYWLIFIKIIWKKGRLDFLLLKIWHLSNLFLRSFSLNNSKVTHEVQRIISSYLWDSKILFLINFMLF